MTVKLADTEVLRVVGIDVSEKMLEKAKLEELIKEMKAEFGIR